jgi:hypothetical protein
MILADVESATSGLVEDLVYLAITVAPSDVLV